MSLSTLDRVRSARVRQASHILVVDDEPISIKLLRFLLEGEGYSVTAAPSAGSALKYLHYNVTDLILLDILMSEMNGLDLSRRIRTTSHVPIVYLTTLADVSDKVVGLRAGGDDYLTKPFDPDEVLARIEALLRRTQRRVRSNSQLKHADLTLDMNEHTVTLHHTRKSVRLTPVEARLLRILLRHRGTTLTRDALITNMWGNDYDSMSSQLDMYIGRLRTKLEEDPSDPTLIETIGGIGYGLKSAKAPPIAERAASR